MSDSCLQAVSQAVPVVALETADDCWRTTWQTSGIGRLWTALKRSLAGHSRLASLGSKLQLASFLVMLALLSGLGLPQFAGDKEVLALIVATGFALRTAGNLFSGKDFYRPCAIDIPVLAYLFSNVIATFASHYLSASLVGLAKVAVYIAAYMLFTQSLQVSPKRVLWAAGALLAGGLLVALYGLYQYKIGVAPLATWEDPNIESKSTRIYSSLGNPNLLAAYLIPLLPLSACLGLACFFKSKWFWALGFLLNTGIVSAATLLTGSRGAYLAMAVVFAALFTVASLRVWHQQPRFRWLILLLALALPVLSWLALQHISGFEQRFASIFAGFEHSSNAFRLQVWRASARMFGDNWWFGIGPGNKTFVLAYGLYMTSGFDALGTYCVPLEIAVETGVFGLLSFAALLLAIFSRAHLCFWRQEDGWQPWLAAGCALGILGIMAHGLVDTVFYRPQVQFIFWFLVAAITALRRLPKSELN